MPTTTCLLLCVLPQGAAKHMELRQEQQKLKDIDLTYIRAKLDMVKGHAGGLGWGGADWSETGKHHLVSLQWPGWLCCKQLACSVLNPQ